MICASVAHLGRDGQSILHTCVEVIVFPSGMIIFNGLSVGLIFLTFAFTAMKWPVVPESSIPKFCKMSLSHDGNRGFVRVFDW